MVRRKAIGIVYIYNEGWIGGTYYIENLIHAINTLEDHRKPVITILTTEEVNYDKLRERVSYPYLQFKPLSLPASPLAKLINRVWQRLFSKNLIEYRINIETVFPYDHYYPSLEKIKRKICWIPDFQEHFIPGFFSEEEIAVRKNYQSTIVERGQYLVLSSHAAKQHFELLYPTSKIKRYVLQFAVTHPDYNSLPIDSLLAKYNLPEVFFIACNQFWKHKNHGLIIEAAKVFKDSNRNVPICIAFTGQSEDYRNPGYYQELLQLISSYGLESEIRCLGFIDRKEQLQLINHSKAVIQPSLFEGWSTVIEDAKAINKKVLASDIPVNREQLEHSEAEFFGAQNAKELSSLLSTSLATTSSKLYKTSNYQQSVVAFGNNFINILEELGS
jgi:glycosyltransferase involved in cell wall biosynthesis